MFEGKVRGRVEVRRDYDNGVAFAMRYDLQGEPPYRVGRNIIGKQDYTRPFIVGRYRMYPIGQDHLCDAVITVPIDGPLWWLPVIRYWRESIGQRLLATAHVWGLADWPMGETPTWRSVYLFRWLAKRLGRA